MHTGAMKQHVATELVTIFGEPEPAAAAESILKAAGDATAAADDLCPICLDPLPRSAASRWEFPCGHSTCRPCFDEYAAHTAHDPMAAGAGAARRTRSGVRVKCPLCRQAVKVRLSG
jgi:hypothetical protein